MVEWGAQGQVAVPAGLTGVTKIAAGWKHSLALRSDGSVVAWLATATARLPIEDRGQAIVPAGLSGVLSVAGGRLDSFAVVTAIVPVVAQAPADVAVAAGEPVNFRVVSSGFPVAAVQWEISADGVTFVAIPGATGRDLSFLAKPTDDATWYRAVLSNPAGSTISPAAHLAIVLPKTGAGSSTTAAVALGFLAAGLVFIRIARRRAGFGSGAVAGCHTRAQARADPMSTD